LLERDLAKSDPINRNYREELAGTYNNYGSFASRSSDWNTAQKCYEDATHLLEDLAKASPQAAKYRSDLAVSFNNLGMAQSRDNRLANAEASFQRAAELQARLITANPDDAQTLSNQGNVWNNLGSLYDREQRPKEAADAFQAAIRFQLATVNAAKDPAPYRALLSRHYFNYAQSLASQGKYEEAVRVVEQRRALWKGDANRLFSIAQELAGIYRLARNQPAAASADETLLDVVASTLQEALAAGLARDRLNDPSLANVIGAAKIQQAVMDRKIGSVQPPNASHGDASRTN
jgi:tetratricopeptide (TPR) repeat protein